MQRKLITLGRILHTGVVNFIRNISLAVAAMAVMVVTLTIVLFSLITNATFENTIAQITNRISVSAYLKDTTTEEQAQQLVARLKKEPEVQRVVYLNKAEALDTYIKQNSSNQNLITAATEAGNPIPATVHVLRRIGVVTVLIFAIICALIIFNTIQMAIFNRRDEITIMRLLGANTTYIRGPFVVESAIYGILSAIASVFIINSAFVASSSALQASSLGLLDINYANEYFDAHFLGLLTLQILIGIVIGTVSSVIATRRYLKFKTK
jgi:cell division transport system permease protein